MKSRYYPVSVLAAQADGRTVTTLEGLQEEAKRRSLGIIADQGAEQCGFCNPGFIMNALALFRENEYPDTEEIREYLAGNLCAAAQAMDSFRIRHFSHRCVRRWKKEKSGK